MTRRDVFTAGIVAVLFGVGFAVGKWTSPQHRSAEELSATGPATESGETEKSVDLLAEIDSVPTSELGKLYKKLTSNPEPDLESIRAKGSASIRVIIPEPDLDTVLAVKKLARRWITEDPDSITDLHLKYELCKEWARIDPHGYLSKVSEQNESGQRQRALGILSQTAPTVLLEYIEQNPELNQEAAYDVPSAIEVLAVSDPYVAADFLTRLGVTPGEDGGGDSIRFPDGSGVSWSADLYGFVGTEMAKHDRIAALGWADSLESLEARGTVLEHILADWARESPEEAASRYQEFAGTESVDLERIVRHIAREDPVAGILWGAKNARPGERREILTSFTSELPDTASIREVHEQLPDENAKANFLRNVLINWHQRDVPEGLEFLVSLTDEKQAQRIRDFGDGVGQSQFDSGMKAAASIKDADLRREFEHSLIRSLATVDFERALVVAKESGDTSLLQKTKEDGYRRFADSSVYGLGEVTSWLEDAQDNYTRNTITDALARRWYDFDPDEAVAWAESLKGAIRSRALGQIAQSMHRTDYESAIEWVSVLQDPKDLAAAFPAIASSLTNTSPQEAFHLASRMQTGARLRHLKQVVQTWAKREPDKAWNAIASHPGLSATERERLGVLIYGRR